MNLKTVLKTTPILKSFSDLVGSNVTDITYTLKNRYILLRIKIWKRDFNKIQKFFLKY